MSYPILYSATETDFSNNGLGILGECASCEVTEEANGIFELSMTYPMDGIHFGEIADRCILKCKADQFREPQLFRIYAISKPMSGIVTVLAQHISYDLSGIPVSPFMAENVVSALEGLKTHAVVDCPFTFMTDKETAAKFHSQTPASIRSRLGGVEGSILDVYGGEYEFDNYNVILHNNRGRNRGVSIRYGKNLTDIRQEQNCSSVATGVYPYWVAGDGSSLVQLPEKIVNAPGNYNFAKIRTVDLSSEFEEAPTDEQLRARAESYIRSNNIGIPAISMTVSFAQLEQNEEYKHLKLLERVSLFDTINIEFPALNVSANAKAVAMVYDVLADRVKSVTLGSVRSNIADTIANQQINMENTPTKSDLRKAQESATAWLTNGKGYKVERRDERGRVIDTLYMDTDDINTAVHVMRIGQSGIGFSHNGVNGPYETAWTIDGSFVASFITAGSLDASVIKSGVLRSENGAVSLNLDDGEFSVIQEEKDFTGKVGYPEFSVANGRLKISGWNYQSGTEYPGISILAGKKVSGGGYTSSEFSATDGKLSITAHKEDSEYGSDELKIGRGYENIDILGGERLDMDADSVIIKGRSVRWEDNGDGTYVLVGEIIEM